MNKLTKGVLLIGVVSITLFLSACGSQNKELFYGEKLILETRTLPEFFEKVIDIVPNIEGEIVFKYYSAAEGWENTVILKYLGEGYEFDSPNFDSIDEIIPLSGKEVIFKAGTLDTQWLFKKHIEIYEGKIGMVKVNSDETTYFIAEEDENDILYREENNEPVKIAEHNIINDIGFDQDGTVAYLFKDGLDGGWQLEYDGFTSDQYANIYEYAIDYKGNPVFLAKDSEGKLLIVKGGKSTEIEGNYKEFSHLVAGKKGYAFSAFDESTAQWKVMSDKGDYPIAGMIRGIETNLRGDIVVSYMTSDGGTSLRFLGEEGDYDSGVQVNDFYLDDYGNLVYIIKGNSGEWQLKVNQTLIEQFVRLDRLFWNQEKIYAAGEKSNGALVYLELTYDEKE